MSSPKTLLVSALNDKLLTDNLGPDSLVGLLMEGENTYRQQNEPHLGEWKPEVPARYPFLGIEVFDIRPMNVEVLDKKFRTTINFRIYSSDQLRTAIIADRVMTLLTEIPPGENVNRWFWDFSSPDIRALSALFSGRLSSVVNEWPDSYEEIVQAQIVWSSAPCDRNAQSVPFVPCPAPSDSGTTC